MIYFNLQFDRIRHREMGLALPPQRMFASCSMGLKSIAGIGGVEFWKMKR